MNRRDALKQIGALALFASGAAWGQSPEQYLVLKTPLPTSESGKIEVLEFFHYGCPHCRDFDPMVSKWAAALPRDVVFLRVPTIWGAPLESLARLYYTLVATRQLGLHEKVFTAVQEERLPLNDPDVVREWARKNGVDVSAFMSAYQSFGVQAQVQRAKQLGRDYMIDGVPTLAVAGRYLTSAARAGSHQASLDVANSLIERVRRG